MCRLTVIPVMFPVQYRHQVVVVKHVPIHVTFMSASCPGVNIVNRSSSFDNVSIPYCI